MCCIVLKYSLHLCCKGEGKEKRLADHLKV